MPIEFTGCSLVSHMQYNSYKHFENLLHDYFLRTLFLYVRLNDFEYQQVSLYGYVVLTWI